MSDPQITFVPVFPPDNIPPHVYLVYMNILTSAVTVHQLEEAAGPESVRKVEERLKTLCKKHLSDSPSSVDGMRLHVDVFKLALSFAQGEQP